jgi:phosphoglycerate dehydrogenase-like enzyme
VDVATEHYVVLCGVRGPQYPFVSEHAVSMIDALAEQFLYLDAQTRKGGFKTGLSTCLLELPVRVQI